MAALSSLTPSMHMSVLLFYTMLFLTSNQINNLSFSVPLALINNDCIEILLIRGQKWKAYKYYYYQTSNIDIFIHLKQKFSGIYTRNYSFHIICYVFNLLQDCIIWQRNCVYHICILFTNMHLIVLHKG